MDLKAEKLSVIQQLLKVEDELLLQAVKNLLEFGLQQSSEKRTTDFWDELTEAQKAQIELSRQQLRAGKGIPHNEVMEAFRKKYSA